MTKSLRNAVNKMCKHCIYDCNAEGTWRHQVAGCTSLQCPLYPDRPLPCAKNRPKTPEIKLNQLDKHVCNTNVAESAGAKESLGFSSDLASQVVPEQVNGVGGDSGQE